jgi:hypothetical protein
VGLNPSLQVSVSDANGQDLTVYFYDNTTGTPILLGTDTVSGGGPGIATINWSGRQYSTVYKWYIKASDGLTNATSATWSFTTRAIPLNLPEEGIPGYQTILLISILGVCVMILLRKMKKTYRKT